MNDLLNMETYEDAWMEVEGEEEDGGANMC